MRERRAFIRIPIGLQATYQSLGEVSIPRLGMSEDLSLGGMRLHHPERLSPGQNVTVTVTLPQEGQVTIRGVVAWSREVSNGRGGYLSGLKWTEINAAVQARLNALLTERTRPQRPVITTFASFPAPILWWRAITLGVIGFLLLALVALLWLDRTRASLEIESLRATLASYERQFNAFFNP